MTRTAQISHFALAMVAAMLAMATPLAVDLFGPPAALGIFAA